MKTLYISVLLLLSIHANAQYLSSGERKQVQAYIKDSIAPLKVTISALTKRVAVLEAKIKSTDSLAKIAFARATTSESKSSVTDITATANKKDITTLKADVKVLKKYISLKGSGSLRITMLNDSLFILSSDTATTTKAGTLTPYQLKRINEKLSTLQSDNTAIKKSMTKLKEGFGLAPVDIGSKKDSIYIIVPSKKPLTILIKE